MKKILIVRTSNCPPDKLKDIKMAVTAEVGNDFYVIIVDGPKEQVQFEIVG